ncbi:hypothetical protein LPB72_06480 [Hydrogenophaga crassostreae]|uniref:DUF3817 domain-containing protein n=1 Tax=Hydrogenophaga crassostreae TaxID=1763535 RepID=A0A163CJW3_9BURK|nr:DUF3817 domain-containing protein [Hydrogenophaga crassostreae]AOW14158.1 hypothetical protein LPB072_16235 [Hydrogenophaga crassostreae]OAD42913.1 hypothetical protein LPB72_06480 [Hydrogenophaga crassostreae]
MPSTPRRHFRLSSLCLLEASTLLLLLLVAVPLKHLAGFGLGVAVMGPAHGLVFLGFCWTLVNRVAAQELTGHVAWKLLAAACLPLGGFYSCRMLRNAAVATEIPLALGEAQS